MPRLKIRLPSEREDTKPRKSWTKEEEQSFIDDLNLFLTNRIMECNEGEAFAFAAGQISSKFNPDIPVCYVANKDVPDHFIVDICTNIIRALQPELLSPEVLKTKPYKGKPRGES